MDVGVLDPRPCIKVRDEAQPVFDALRRRPVLVFSIIIKPQPDAPLRPAQHAVPRVVHKTGNTDQVHAPPGLPLLGRPLHALHVRAVHALPPILHGIYHSLHGAVRGVARVVRDS